MFRLGLFGAILVLNFIMTALKTLILFFMISSRSFAADCLPPMPLEDFKQLVLDTREVHFPELHDLNILISTFESGAYFLQAQPSLQTIFKKSSKRNYEIQLNLRLLECPPDLISLQAILVHELEHLKDYNSWSSKKIITHGLRYVTDRNFRSRYERQTDLKALVKGFSVGLMGYRHWVYQWLTPKELKLKKRYYFTPEEISIWQGSQF
jgi:hypothetical protein